MDLLQMEYFVRVAESPTMLQAAESLNVSQSTLSMSIKKLESELGIKLFRREGHSLKLTEAGLLLHRGASRILFDVAVLKENLLTIGTARSNTVILATDAVDYAIETVYTYSALYPQSSVEHIRVKHSNMRALLLSRQVDFCISLCPIVDDNITSTLLLSEPMYLLASSDSRFAKMDHVRMLDLVNETLITLSDGNSLRELFESYFSMLGLRPRAILEVGELEALSMSVRKRFGITFAPQCVQGKKDFLHDMGYSVCTRPMQESFCYRNLYLSKLKNHKETPEHRSYLDFLQKYTDMVIRLQRFPELEEYRAAYDPADHNTPST